MRRYGPEADADARCWYPSARTPQSSAAGWVLAAAAVGPGDDVQQVTVRVLEVQPAAAVPVVDNPRPGPPGIRPVRQVLAANPGKGSIELLLTHEEGVVLGVIFSVVSAKSRETPLSASTTRKCANRAGGGRPRIAVKKAADRC